MTNHRRPAHRTPSHRRLAGLGSCAALAATCIVVTAMPTAAATTCSTVSGTAAGSVTAAGITLSQQQATNAMAVVVAGRLTGMSNRDEAIAIMTGYTESSIRRLSNPAVAGSSSYPNDGSGTDHDSVGVFQQRPSWGPTSVLMDAAGSANLFYNRLATVPNRDSQTMWADAQAVQVSAYPDGSNYEPYADFGTQLVAQWAGQNLPVVVNCDGHTSTGGTKTFSPALARFGGSTWTFYSTNIANGTGVTDQMVTWSGTLAGDVPLVGDWNGDGVYTPGLGRFSGSTWTFYLTNIANGTGVTDQIVTWSGTLASDVPLVGDWNGDGKDSPGLARLSGSTRTYYLTNIVNGTGVTDQIVTWPGATASDGPLVGDWNGDGKDSPGLARLSGSTRTYYLTNIVNGTGVTDQIVTWPGATASDVPLVGDWNGDGKDSPGLARLSGSTRTYYLTNIVNGTGVTDQIVTWPGATASDVPLVGPWT